MTHWLDRRASLAGVLLLPALTGCVIHKASPPPVAAIAPAPEAPPAPLYIADLNQSVTALPDIPAPPLPNAQPTPPPRSDIEIARSKRPAPPVRRGRSRRGETEVAERESREREKEKEQEAAQTTAATAEATQATAAVAPAVDKVTAPTPAGDTTQSTPLGPLTASTTQDDSSKHQAGDLIEATQRGINSLHRALSGEQEKTVAQIRSFLIQAQRAMHNGDVDGAYTLATKAKVLLDELNGTT